MLRTAGSFWPGDAASALMDTIADNNNTENTILLIILDPSIGSPNYNIFDTQLY